LRSGRINRTVFSIGLLGGDISDEIKKADLLDRLIRKVDAVR
jgi:hypothetical protein